MKNYLFYLLIFLIYLFFGYNIFKSKSYGSLKHLLSNIILCFFILIGFTTFVMTSNNLCLYVPILPLIIYLKIDNDIKKKLKSLLYKKIDNLRL
jgi:hypothetical protein